MKKTLICICCVILSACTWVKLTPDGEKVRVLEASEVTSCKNVGRTTVSLKDKVAGIERNRDKVKQELEYLARNSATSLDGDTVVAISEPRDGIQVFAVYRCINP